MTTKNARTNLLRRVKRWQKNPPAIPVALGPVDDDLVELAYRAKDGTLGIAVFENRHSFRLAPAHVQAYIRSITARHLGDRSESRRRVRVPAPPPG